MQNEQITYVPHIVMPTTINLVLNGQPYTFTDAHPSFEDIKEALRDRRFDDLPDLIDVPQAVSKYSDGAVEIKDGSVYYKGELQHSKLAEFILQMLREGHDIQPFVRFMEKLYLNPSRRSVEQLFDYVQANGLTIDEDGDVMAQKSVREDYTDWYSGTFDNRVGVINDMDRNKVDDDPRAPCSFGLHVGGYSYVKSFGGYNARKMLVKFNPRDAVSVPFDANAGKIRVCRYEVVAEIEREQFVKAPVYDTAVYTPTVANADDLIPGESLEEPNDYDQITIEGVVCEVYRDSFGEWQCLIDTQLSDGGDLLDSGTGHWDRAYAYFAAKIRGLH